MPVQIKFDPHITMPQVAIIPDATPRNDGVMTALQSAQLAALVAGGGGGGGGGFVVVPAIADISAAFGQLVDGDPAAASFNVFLPLASSVLPGGSNAIIVKNESASPNFVTARTHAGDSIDSGGPINLFAGQYLYLISDGANNWIVVSQSSGSGGVANIYDRELTTTNPTTILSATRGSAGGICSASLYIRVITAPTDLTAIINYTDASGVQQLAWLDLVNLPIGVYAFDIKAFETAPGSLIDISLTAGTANHVFATAQISGAQ
jgi:hypothetical protein